MIPTEINFETFREEVTKLGEDLSKKIDEMKADRKENDRRSQEKMAAFRCWGSAIETLDSCIPYSKKSFKRLKELLLDDMSYVYIADYGSRKVRCTKYLGSTFMDGVPLTYLVKRINDLVKSTPSFSAKERDIANRVALKVNRMWEEADTQIKSKNFVIQLFYMIGKLFGKKTLIVIPPEIRPQNRL